MLKICDRMFLSEVLCNNISTGVLLFSYTRLCKVSLTEKT